jgi:hypothetical protein
VSTRKRGAAGLPLPCPLDHPMGERVTKEFLDRNSVTTHEKGALPVQRESFFHLGKTIIAVQSLPTRTARRSVPTSEALRDRRLFGLNSGFLPQTPPRPRTSGVGRFLRKRHVDRAGPLGDRSLPRRLFGIGGSSGYILDSRYKLHLAHAPPGVGRFLRKRHVDRLSTDRW